MDCRLVILCFLCLVSTMSEYIPFLSFYVWITSFRMGFPSICLQISRCHCFLLLSSTPLCKCTTLFFYPFLVEEHLGCFQVLAVINNAAMNTVEQMSLWYASAFLGYMPKSGIAGS